MNFKPGDIVVFKKDNPYDHWHGKKLKIIQKWDKEERYQVQLLEKIGEKDLGEFYDLNGKYLECKLKKAHLPEWL